ncbi:hypothetical protein [Sideroxydans lithotrophicus]|uniref:Uncharacterized protein n=1 Tax=Sideroxydans lithotrophicus (strain ES-1) TaxID=580332 RepID=D5CLG3_SIDLE|nr:hypothetical protein [Sideroxydans lithotrophicus]ADE10551.1 hypothetical protein Slit_0309 [Sideroxydans lithotrophicus ES-1]
MAQNDSPKIDDVTPEHLEAAYTVPAVLANRFIGHNTLTGLRLAFAEQANIQHAPHFHSAVVLSTSDAVALVNLIQVLIARAQQPTTPDEPAEPSDNA